MANRRDGIETRRRILAAACDVFAERGYRGATNAEICRRSEANGAAINYHFRSKEALYSEAFKLALEESMNAHPLCNEDGKKVEERLKSMIQSIINRISDPANKSFAMLHKEMSEPTGLLDNIMGAFLNTESKDMKALVGEILKDKGSEREIELCATSVLAQCVHPSLVERGRIEGRHPPHNEMSRPFDAKEIAEHVFNFSMTALSSYRQGKIGDAPSRREP